MKPTDEQEKELWEACGFRYGRFDYVASISSEIKGIITYDRDFGRIATKGIVQKRSSTNFWLGNAGEFLRKYEIKSKVRRPSYI